MKTYSTWRSRDIAAFIPGISDLATSPDGVDFSALQEELNKAADSQLISLQEITKSDDFRLFRETKDPGALARVLKRLEISRMGMTSNDAFFQCAAFCYPEKLADFRNLAAAIMPKTRQLALSLNQAVVEVMGTLSQMDDASVSAMLEAVPELQRFEKFIDRFRKAPKPDVQKLAALDPNEANAAYVRYAQSMERSLSKEEREKALAEGVSRMVKFKHDRTVANGFSTTLAHFNFFNDAPADFIDNLERESAKRIAGLADNFAEIRRLADDKLPEAKITRRYTWQEATDIVCAAYGELDSELGKLARRAFDEGWVLAKETGIPNPITLSGIPASANSKAHPFVAGNFDGRAVDVLWIAHEMAHALANYVSGRENGSFSYEPSYIVQESFSHFGEALLEKEMLKRASGNAERAQISMAFVGKELDSLMLVPFSKFEEDLYKLIANNSDKTPPFDEINNLYKKHFVLQKKLTGTEADVRTTHGLWPMLNQPPHISAVYPITKIMAAALHDEFERSPEKFRARYRQVMERGGNIDIRQLWNTLLGNGVAEQKAFVGARLDKFAARMETLRRELEALPELKDIAKDEKMPVGPHTSAVLGKDPKAQGGAAREFPN